MSKQIHVPLVGKDVSDLLLWRDPKKSGAIAVIGSAAYAYLTYSPTGPVVLTLTLLSYLTAALFFWSSFAAILSRPGPPVPAIFKQGVSEEDIRSTAEKLRGPVNKVLATLAVLISGKDMQLSLLVAAGAWAAAWLFKRVPVLTLAYAVFFLAFALPKAYELKKDEVDKALATAQAKLNELLAKFKESVSPILAKIPKSKAQ